MTVFRYVIFGDDLCDWFMIELFWLLMTQNGIIYLKDLILHNLFLNWILFVFIMTQLPSIYQLLLTFKLLK